MWEAFVTWLKELFTQTKVVPSDAKSEVEESIVAPSKTYGVPVTYGTKVLSTGVDKEEGELDWYRRLYPLMQLRKGKESIVISAAKLVIAGQARYERVAKVTGVPWYVIGVAHYKEASCSFNKVLHNGETLANVNAYGTRLVPAGRGKGQNWTWEEAAIDAITLNGGRWAKIRAGAKDIGTILYALERYNGVGYISGAGRADVSPYIWDCTTVYDGTGRYVADGKYSSTALGDKSAGCAGILRYMEGVRAINIAGNALLDVGPIPQSPTTQDGEEIGEGLLEMAQLAGVNAAHINQLIAFQKKDRPGKNPRYWALFNVVIHSSNLRFFIFDRVEKQVHAYRCAHGSGSDPDHNGFADKFSNVSGSNCTSLGMYRVSETYIGKHGLSCKLDGKEPTNSNARARAIVLHGASYVEASYVEKNGKTGRSQGCPAVPDSVSKDIVTKLANGSPLFIVKG